MTDTLTTASGAEPRLLLVLLSPDWHGQARLPRAFAKAGFHVASLCPAESLMAKTRFAEKIYLLPTQESALPYLVTAIRSFQPDIVIPASEDAVQFLHEVHHAGLDGRLPEQEMGDVLALVRRSLGYPEYFKATLNKHQNHAVAAKLGVRVPRQQAVKSSEDAADVAGSFGYPVALKSDYGCAGRGERICSNRGEVEQAYHSLVFGVNQANIAVQQFIAGTLACHTVAAWGGEVLEGFVALQIHAFPTPTSPSSVVRFIENADTKRAMEQLVREYGYTGICSADFIIERTTQRAYLLELNPRPVPLCGFAALSGHDVCRALYCHLSGQPYQRASIQPGYDTVALFPNEWSRDLQSPYLRTAYHDVPWDDPSLLYAIMDPMRPIQPRLELELNES